MITKFKFFEKRVAFSFPALVILTLIMLQAGHSAPVEDTAWTPVFNGKNLDGWKAKFANVQYPANPDSTFRIIDGNIAAFSHRPFDKVSFGHLFFLKRKFSWFYMRLEYKFLADTLVAGFPAWDLHNSGFMFHCPPPETMPLALEFPNSVEIQILGSKSQLGATNGNSMNVCTPGTRVSINGQPSDEHCINASPKDISKMDWVQVSAFVFGDSAVLHMVGKDTVLRYTKTIYEDGSRAMEGYVALQAEGAPIAFRNIQILDLVGCMDKTSPNYRSYFKKNDDADCSKIVSLKPRTSGQKRFAINLNNQGFPLSTLTGRAVKRAPSRE